ncbi:MAG: hypothetical protein ACTSUV_02015 [Candidatus Ranarchaeia archaeon]
MSKHTIVNQKIPKKKWLETVEKYRKGRTYPVDTEKYSISSSITQEIQGLLGIINAFSKMGYQLFHDYKLIEPKQNE